MICAQGRSGNPFDGRCKQHPASIRFPPEAGIGRDGLPRLLLVTWLVTGNGRNWR